MDTILIGIAGGTGSGKTTLLNILAALDKPTSGEILLNGKNIVEISDCLLYTSPSPRD